MNMRDLIPWSRTDRDLSTTPPSAGDSLFTLHREMNRLFDDVFRGFDSPALQSASRGVWPQMEVEETDKDYRVTAELPGLEEKDIELQIQDNVLILKGEKKSETKDPARAFSERFYGRFERRIALEGADEAKAAAEFRNGVLTVTVPKSAQDRDQTRRIPINRTGATH